MKYKDFVHGFIREYFPFLGKLLIARGFIHNYFPSKKELGSCGANTRLESPIYLGTTKNVFIGENVTMRCTRIINSSTEKVIIKSNTVLGPECMIITNSHSRTVTLPISISAPTHINDKSGDVIIGEDVWTGARAIITAGVELGRGCVVGAGSIVTRSVPPYALVVGSPARIVKVVFTIEQILEHEKVLYPESERFSREYLENLFEENYKGLKVFGTSDGIDEEALKKIEIIKAKTHFVDWKNTQQ